MQRNAGVRVRIACQKVVRPVPRGSLISASASFPGTSSTTASVFEVFVSDNVGDLVIWIIWSFEKFDSFPGGVQMGCPPLVRKNFWFFRNVCGTTGITHKQEF